MKIRVVNADRLYLPVKRFSDADGCFQSGEGLGTTIDPDEDMPRLVKNLLRISDDESVCLDAPHNSLHDAAEQAVLDRAHTEGTHYHKVVIAIMNILNELDEVLAFRHLGFKGDIIFGAFFFSLPPSRNRRLTEAPS